MHKVATADDMDRNAAAHANAAALALLHRIRMKLNAQDHSVAVGDLLLLAQVSQSCAGRPPSRFI